MPHGAGLVSEGDISSIIPAASRTDNAATLNNGTRVLDTAVVAGDVGRTVIGNGIPNNTTIQSVVAGQSFIMNRAATQTATGVSLTIRRVDANTAARPVRTTSGSTTVTDWNITLADNGRTVTSSNPSRFSGSRTISNVNVAAHTFTISGLPATSTGATTLTINKNDANAATNDGTLVLDPAVTANDVGRNVSGTGVPAGATVLSVTPGQSFVMSLKATQNIVGNAVVTLATPDFSNPVLFNNIFWNNQAYTVDQFGHRRDADQPGIHRLRDPRHHEQQRHVHAALLRQHQQPDPGPRRRAAQPARRPGQHYRRQPELRRPVRACARRGRLATRPATGVGDDHRQDPIVG